MIRAEHLVVRYRGSRVMDDVSIGFESGLVHSILGPNGCGKSTLLKVLSRQLKGENGVVYIDGKEIREWGMKSFARQLAMLAQSHEDLSDISVYDLVSYGRFPHKGFIQRLDEDDRRVVDWALQLTGMNTFSSRSVRELSGGERQRARIAMAVAQQPKVLLLDEPTTYLDICHQLEIMELVVHLNRVERMTVIMVLHELNHAAAFSDRITVMKQGAVYAQGQPCEVIVPKMLRDVFHVDACVAQDIEGGCPVIKSMKLLTMGNSSSVC
ncbi:iron complex transport system ATP-binding protein [Paenibacillus sp. UNCCL117]|uniref:ABC transporter ATP-binding protein n=1 Tax=unclassified Paenibacillus TaxID=185978 RepID=UPI0008882F0C|nr:MULTISPECIES: ABC transporter ATP-binding protein [unclassified Paenibacillus]SDE41596.1 iron complex transport system ATP-binding protein [Paenibacillus sp. cl123]SFW65512.1 iron complex transport system ATP-binding protein [Paenibacillus sp. UNCCL117]